jgi:hypothetical protein
MAERPPGAPRPGRDDRLWFLAQPDAFLRRFILRTVLEPPRSLRGLRPRGLRR